MCFFQGQTLFWPYLRNGWSDLCETKRKSIGWILVYYMTLTFDLTHDLDLGCFKVKFRNSCISGIVGLIDVKWKGSELIWYWADCMTLLALWPHPCMTLTLECQGQSVILTCVTMVGWADVPDSDRGDLGRWRAVDISSYCRAEIVLRTHETIFALL